MSRTALALSPHLDDAAFSAGGLLATLADAGWRVVVATAFTASVPDPQGFALACQTDKGLGPAVDYMALRRDEDAAALAALGAEPRWLPFREAPHRGYDSALALFGPVRPDDEADREVAPALRALSDELRPDLLLAPQAIGGHVDHVQLVRALDSLADARPTLWWRDFPYVTRDLSPAEPFGEIMAGRSAYEAALMPSAYERKRRACLAYRSQLGFQFGGPAGLDARLAETGGIELYRRSGPLVPLP